jgi:predicted  nucleic acid-binding Zn-ribbon protein
MFPALARLVKLQQLDTAIADAKSRIASHPQRLADADARLAAASQALDSVKQRLKDNHDGRRALEKDVAVYQGRLSKFKDQQSAVKTNREYQALGHEIETAQHDLGGVEEKMLELMVEADTLAENVKKAEGDFAVRRREIEAEKKALDEELSTLESSLKEATASRAALVAELEPRLLAIFEQVARARKGVAVTTATRDGLCSFCHVRLRPPVFQQVRHNEAIVQCESCQRILYYVPPPPPVEPAVIRTS